MKCPKCQSENPTGSKFCLECGEKLELRCPQCGQALQFEARFCNECGHDLRKPKEAPPVDYDQPHSYTPKHLSDKILTTRSAIKGERKVVTVLFADVADSTAIFEKLDPEDVHHMMDGCFKILMDEIHKYEGTINQFTGDGVMAIFGAPIAHEDHAQRACYAALEIQRSLEGYSEEIDTKYGFEFKMRIGINSGPVVVGSIGDDLRMDYTADGDTTNLAARMEALAEPRKIYVAYETVKHTETLFQFKSLGERKVKGKERLVPVYELLSAKEDIYRPRLGTERMIYSEMVDRDRELDRLELQVMKALNGEGSVVNVIGEAGIGKSRLIAELKRLEVLQRVTLIEGRAISIGRNLSFHPIIDLLKQWAQIREEDRDSVALRKLENAVISVCPEKIGEVLPFVATLMGLKLFGKYEERVRGIEGEALEKLIMKNMREILIQGSKLNPLVIVMEDLHWADASSIELMESLFRLSESQRILFINVFRPGHEETGDRIIKTIKESLPVYYVEIVLQPLNERMSEALINNILKIEMLHHALVDQIVERSGGNPFFIEEVVCSLVDIGAVVLRRGSFEITERMDTVVVPQTITDLLVARIDRLEEQTRNLLKIASVIGRSFFHRILIEVARIVEDIDGRLSYLKRIELIREREKWGELEYLFKHALTQEVAYESILLKKRKELHLRVANCIEKIFRERLREFFGMLAYHYSMGEDEEKAEEYLIKAGEEALKSSASSEALHFYREALKLFIKKHGDAADPGKKAMLEKNIAVALFNRGQYIESVEYFDKALTFYGEKTPKHTVGLFLAFLANFFAFLTSLYLSFLKFKKIPTKRDNEIINLLYKKSAALAVTDPKRMFIEAFYLFRRLSKFDVTKVENGIGMLTSESPLFSWPGISFKISKKALEHVKDKVSANDLKSRLYHDGAGLLHISLAGDWGTEKEYEGNLVDRNTEVGEFFWTSIYVYWHGYLNIERGCIEGAQAMVDKLSEISEEYDNNYSRVLKYALNTALLAKFRRFHDTLIEAEEGIKFGTKTGFGIWAFSMSSLKVRVQVCLGDIRGAENSLNHSSKIKSEIDIVPFYLSHFLLSQFLFDLRMLRESINTHNRSEIVTEKRKRALISGRRAVRISRKAAPERTEAFRLMGTLYWTLGRQKRALQWWNKSIKEGERIGARLELSRTYMEVGTCLLESNSRYQELNGVGAKEYLGMASSMFKEIGLEWDLAQLDRILTSNS